MDIQRGGTHWNKPVIKGLAEHGRGTIVNILSRSADQVMPLLAKYSAVKMS